MKRTTSSKDVEAMTTVQEIPGVKKHRYRKLSGRCYEIAFRFVLDNSDWVLVHGVLDLSDSLGETHQQYFHAWAEREDHVFDPAHNYFYDKKWFYSEFNAQVVRKFSQREAAEVAFSEHHFGPWH